jgi:hypothetical protein
LACTVLSLSRFATFASLQGGDTTDVSDAEMTLGDTDDDEGEGAGAGGSAQERAENELQVKQLFSHRSPRDDCGAANTRLVPVAL